MNPQTPLRLLRSRERAALSDAARQRAHQLRTEAEHAFFTAIARSIRRLAYRAWTALRDGHAAPHVRC